jgi:putative membrane protein
VKLALRVIITAVGLWAAAELVEGIDLDPDRSLVYLVLVALIVGLLNATVRPILALLSLPLVIATLGLFLLVINVAMLALAFAISARFDLGLTSDSLTATLLAAIIVSVVGWLANGLLGTRRCPGGPTPAARRAGGSVPARRSPDDRVDASADVVVDTGEGGQRPHVLDDLLGA